MEETNERLGFGPYDTTQVVDKLKLVNRIRKRMKWRNEKLISRCNTIFYGFLRKIYVIRMK